MATYRFEAKVIGRSAGRSATASAAYRAAERIQDERTGQSFDYTRKSGVLHAEIMTPAGTPDWMRDRSQLWNAVEKAEKRKDAQLARDLVLSLPHELSADERRELVRDFVKEQFVSEGMIADIAIHAPDRRGDQRNHHAHVMLTMRELTAGGFGMKAREWNSTELLEQWRERWADAVNRQLERGGHAARVDHRSLNDQGLDREPEPKQGPVATKMEKEGRASHAGEDRRAVKERNQERAEIATELEAIEAEIIDLQAERQRRFDHRQGGQPVRKQQDMEEDEQQRSKLWPSVATSSGSMYAQNEEARQRFEKNSAALQERQAEQKAAAGDEQQQEPSEPNQGQASAEQDQGEELSSREAHRRLKSESGHDQSDDIAPDRKLSNDERLKRLEAQMARNLSRDGRDDRSR